MGILSGLFRSRDAPKDSTAGSAYRFFMGGSSSGKTEAGTTQRDVVRSGVVKIAVSFSVSPAWLKRLTAYSKLPKITVLYFDTEDLAQKETEMYISGYKAKLEKDTSYKGLWTVSFTLNEF